MRSLPLFWRGGELEDIGGLISRYGLHTLTSLQSGGGVRGYQVA